MDINYYSIKSDINSESKTITDKDTIIVNLQDKLKEKTFKLNFLKSEYRKILESHDHGTIPSDINGAVPSDSNGAVPSDINGTVPSDISRYQQQVSELKQQNFYLQQSLSILSEKHNSLQQSYSESINYILSLQSQIAFLTNTEVWLKSSYFNIQPKQPLLRKYLAYNNIYLYIFPLYIVITTQTAINSTLSTLTDNSNTSLTTSNGNTNTNVINFSTVNSVIKFNDNSFLNLNYLFNSNNTNNIKIVLKNKTELDYYLLKNIPVITDSEDSNYSEDNNDIATSFINDIVDIGAKAGYIINTNINSIV